MGVDKTIGLKSSAGLADKAIKACDADGDGYVDKDEFFQIVGKLSVLSKNSGGKKMRTRGIEDEETDAAQAFNDASPLTEEEMDDIDEQEDELEEELEEEEEEEEYSDQEYDDDYKG